MSNNSELEQAIVTNVPSSPLVSNTPDFLLTSLIKLSRDYLQDRNVAFLGHAMKMMRPFAGALCHANGIATYDEMLATDPEVSKGINVLHLASTSNEINFGAPKTFSSTQDQQSAEIAADFMNEMVEQMELPFDPERKKIVLDALLYGNGIGELNFGTGYGSLKDKLVVKQMRATNLENVVMITDSFNRIIGYAPYGFPGVIAPLDSWMPADGFVTYLFDNFERQRDREDAVEATQMLPKYKVLHLQWQALSKNPRGGALLDAAFQPWWAKQQIIPILLYFIEKWAVPRKVGILGEKAEAIKLKDAYGAALLGADGAQMTREPLSLLFEKMQEWGPDGSLGLPHGFNADLVQGNHEMISAITGAIEFFNREISSAITKQFLSAGQGQKSGGEKGVQSHRDVLSLMILKIKNDQSSGIRNQICKPLIAANYGRAAKRFAPKADLGDADGFPVTLDELGFLAQSMPDFFTKEMYPEIGRKIGFPYIPSERKTVLPRSAIKDVTALQALLATQLDCDQGAFTVEFVEG